MQKMGGLDLEFAVEDMQILAGKRIAKIRKTESGIYLFKAGTGEILFEPGIRLHLTRQVLQAADSPDGFVSFLRKNLEGKTAVKISKVQGERILEIETKSKERLVFECFRKGNLILVGEDGKIMACLHADDAGGRRIARGEAYAYPQPTPFAAKRPVKIGFCVQESGQGAPVSFSCDAAAGGRAFPSFSEAADFYYANAKSESGGERKAGERVAALEARLRQQMGQIAELEAKKSEMAAKAEAILANFEQVESALLDARKSKAAKIEIELQSSMLR